MCHTSHTLLLSQAFELETQVLRIRAQGSVEAGNCSLPNRAGNVMRANSAGWMWRIMMDEKDCFDEMESQARCLPLKAFGHV